MRFLAHGAVQHALLGKQAAAPASFFCYRSSCHHLGMQECPCRSQPRSQTQQIDKYMKSPKTLIALAVLGTAFSLRSDDELALEQCPANVQETIRANARDGKVDEVKSITIDDRTL
jgi:hypothetical protein